MTFQEAQVKFSSIVAGISTNMSSAQLVQKMQELIVLQTSLPNTAEFDLIVATIVELLPKLSGQVTVAVVSDLKSRDESFKETSDLLTQVSKKAATDARKLTFEDPKLVLAALDASVRKLKQIQGAAKSGNFEEVASTVDSLVTLVEQVRGSVKTT